MTPIEHQLKAVEYGKNAVCHELHGNHSEAIKSAMKAAQMWLAWINDIDEERMRQRAEQMARVGDVYAAVERDERRVYGDKY